MLDLYNPNLLERSMWRLLLLALLAAAEDSNDGDRKVLGSSVVTSVSVIMDAGNGSKIYTDAVGKPVSKPHVATDVASPIELLNPDRYEFYTFDDDGDLIKRLMTLEEIQDIIATGDDDVTLDAFMPEKRVNDVVNNVQNVLKEEIKQHKNPEKPEFDTPDVSDSWSMILPAVFGNSGADIKPEPPTSHVTPDTVLVMATTEQISTTQKVMTLQTDGTSSTSTTTSTTSTPMINVEIITNSNSTTERTENLSPVVEIKPQQDVEFKNNVRKGTKRPFPAKSTTFKPLRRPTRTTTLITSPSTTTTTTTTTKPPTTTTTELVEETVVPEASVQFEKIAQETTTTTELSTTTTTELETTTTEKPSTTETTSTERLRITETTTISTERPSTTEKVVPETTTTPPQEETSTFGTFSTFFLINDNKNRPEPDLSTLGTEYVTIKTVSTNTTESTVPDLEQFLLTSTNIYEINSQLSEGTSTSSEEKTETTEASEKFLIRLTNPTEVPSTTTDQTFIETIEQLISQAVGTPGPVMETQKEASMVEEMMIKSANKTMDEVMAETATAGSSLIGVTTVVPTTETTTIDDRDLLSDSVDSLLSQILQFSTTVEPETTTVVPITVPSESHIINITIIRNEPKPAKADLSLEMEYDAMIDEMRKNGTLVLDETTVGTTTEETTTESSTSTSSTTTEAKPSIEITINESTKNDSGGTWTLVSTLSPHTTQPPQTTQSPLISIVDPPAPVDLVPKPLQGFGLEDSTANLDTDIYQFVQLCNELAFGFWKSVTNGLSSARSVVVSPFAATSLLAMVFLGARGATSGEMNEILKLDDMVTFNPHLIFKNVSESIEATPDSGVAVSAIIRELYSDRSKGKLLGFYKERVRQFYDGHVEEASFREIGDVIRRRTNLLVKKNTDGRIAEFLKDGNLVPKPPLAGVSVSIFQTDCSQGSTEGRDGELHFVVLPSLRQRRLIPIPATVYRSGFVAGYEPSLDATAAALGSKDSTISTIFIIPGQQGVTAPGDGLSRLEKRLVESSFKKGAWSRLLRSLIPRPGLELQIPRFQHRSLVNATQSLKRMGLHELFDSQKADLKGLNGAAHELYLSDVVQLNEFATCGEGRVGEGHHKEVYPATAERRSLDWEYYQRAFHDPLHDPRYLDLPLAQRPRQARLPETPRLRFDRPFLYFVRHNPSGLILHMGRFHPRLLP